MLTACSSGTSALVGSIRQKISAPEADTASLNPQLTYLRTQTGKTVALLVLGYIDQTPNPDTEVWYSGDKETIRLWHGRLAGTAGLASNWRDVRFQQVPTWRAALSGDVIYRRQRDAMPGYAVAIREQVRIVPTAAPADSSLVGLDPRTLQWFEEWTTVEGLTPGLPVARFAVDMSGAQEKVVYSEQCLSASLCLSFQSWPANAARSLPTSSPL